MDALMSLTAPEMREIITRFLAGYFNAKDPGFIDATISGAAQVLDSATDEELQRAMTTYAGAGRHWRIHEADPVLRALSRDWMSRCMPKARVSGLENLPEDGRGCLWICNHLSYVDTQLKDALLSQSGLRCADDLLVVAGPKVYSEPFRRVAATALNTLMTPQSGRLLHNETHMSQREIAGLALDCMKLAQAWMTERGPLLLYPEGSRSRTGRLGSFLRAAARYLRGARLVIPVAVSGSEQLFAYDERLRIAQVSLSFGVPFDPGSGSRDALEHAWRCIAELLPPEYAPSAETPMLR